MRVTLKSLAAEDRAAQKDVEKDIAFMAAAGENDGAAVVALVEKALCGEDDRRLVAGIEALKRIMRASRR